MSSYEPASTSHSSRTSSIPANRQHSLKASHPYLHPEDAFHASSPPKKLPRQRTQLEQTDASSVTALTNVERHSQKATKRSSRSRSRRGTRAGNSVPKGQWKKLLWVKQSYPDNYTDEETFLDHLQRNPRLRPYEFWPLVADSTIIVQHVCSVVIFLCCFTAIFQERVKPETVVGWATGGTVAGWVVRDWWQGREDTEVVERRNGDAAQEGFLGEKAEQRPNSPAEGAEFGMPFKEQHIPLATTPTANSPNGMLSHPHSRDASAGSSVAPSPTLGQSGSHTTIPPSPTTHIPSWHDSSSALSPRMQDRLTTFKSAILIYCSLLGLSPILKSLTKSTSSDSIWAMSSWLMLLNVMTFDYGAGPEAKFPASLSTNAALMASTVLASRLPSTTHVFSLTLFSIEVFGLFPVFRRHLRHHSWNGHLLLTTFLVILASGSLSMTISGGGYIMGIVGVVLGGAITCLSMGATSMWLLGLQRYKNEIHGPWDPARPVIRRHWD